MKTTLILSSVMFALVPAIAVGADGWAVFDGGWRISAGAVYDSGVKTRMRFAPQQTYRSPFSLSADSLTRRQAQEAAQGTTEEGSTRTTYVNANPQKGGNSFIDTDDYGYPHENSTFNYSIPASVWDGGTSFELGWATFEEISSWQSPYASQAFGASDDSAMPGINVELSRNLYHDTDIGWGVDAAFAVQYFRRNRAFRSGGNWAIGSSQKSKDGGYSMTYNATGDLGELLPGSAGDPQLWNDNGTLANDNFDLDLNPGNFVPDGWEDLNPETDSSYGRLYADGDYENLELMLLARPYYDIYDWLRINGTLGVVVSRQSMEMSFSMFRDGQVDYHSHRDFSQWDVYGVGGLGLMFYYKDFTLSADFFARFLDDDMDISDRYYKGSVRRGHWMFKLSAGYEF